VTGRARRRVVFAVLVVALTLPAESVLVRALEAPDQTAAARQWATQLSSPDLSVVAARIVAYPYVYRRAVMAALPPALRAIVWRTHIQSYADQHPELGPQTTALLYSMVDLITPAAVSGDRSNNAAVADLATQIQAALGKDVTEYLLYRLGPKDAQVVSALPFRERLANFARQQFIALAQKGGDCDCSTNWGCDLTSHCDGSTGCTPDDTWPMCGWLWNDECDGTCRGGIAG
jgi:hypothetical protein